MAKFKPSSQSDGASEQTQSALQYIKKAAAYLESRSEQGAVYPAWVQNHIIEAATALGIAVNYTHFTGEDK